MNEFNRRSWRLIVSGRRSLAPLLLFLAGAVAAAKPAPTVALKAPSGVAPVPDNPARIQRRVEGSSMSQIVPARLPGEVDAVPPPIAPPIAVKGIGAQGIEAVASNPTITAFTASPTPPKPWGTTITWTVTATGGVAPLQYEFYRFSAATGIWTLVRPYSTTATFAWTPTVSDIGSYQLSVWVRNNGSTAPFDASSTYPTFSVLSNQPTITSFTANTTFPKRVGTAITWTATVTGGLAPLQYQFYRYSYATATWSIVQPYGTSRTFSWTPTNADIGRYALQVWVRNNGSTAPYDAFMQTNDFDLIGAPPTISSLAANVTFPSPAGQPITWTTTATGGVPPLQYAFYRYTAATGIWSLAQGYTTSNAFTWIPAATDVGQFEIEVWVRDAGSSIPYDAFKISPIFSISAAKPLAVSSFGSYPPVPRPQGSILIFAASASGGLQPLSYSFYRYSYQTSTWTLVQDWSASSTFTWTPTAANVGDYSMAVWVRNNGSTAPYDATMSMARFSITPPDTDIVRFLEQATWGPTDAEIQRVRQMGMAAWIDDQFAQPPTGYPVFTPVTDNPGTNCTGNCQRDNYSMYPLQKQFFLNALYGNDQLRQRVAFAIHSLVVTSGIDLPLPSWSQPYHDAIWRNVFGNYWQLLYDVTLNPGMGDYLNLNTSTLNNPNENYAREIMQLFSLGTGLLNVDGTYQRLGDGSIIPTYDQFTVTEFARALTCWHLATNIGPGITNYRDPMICTTANHDLGSKQLLNGFTTGAGASGAQDLFDVINNIFNHPNVGPYLARHLIRQLVTSNPSPEYIARVASVFNNNGSGLRGDLKAVVKALLLDPEARATATSRRDPAYGSLKSPPVLITEFLRAMNVKSANGLGLSDGYLAPQSLSLGEDVLQPPTVFSYFPADYLLPGTAVGAPEFGVFNTVTSLRRANFVNTMVFSNIPVSNPNAPNGTSIDLSVLKILAGNPSALLKELDRILLNDTMSPEMQTSILAAVNAVSASNPLLRAQTALYLVATSSQYQVKR